MGLRPCPVTGGRKLAPSFGGRPASDAGRLWLVRHDGSPRLTLGQRCDGVTRINWPRVFD